MKVTVTATENFHPACAECAQVIGLLVSAAIKAPALTRLNLKGGSTHCHPVAEKPRNNEPTLFTMPTTGNGFDYDGNHRGA